MTLTDGAGDKRVTKSIKRSDFRYKTMPLSAFKTSQQKNEERSPATSSKTAGHDRTSVSDFIEMYGNFIWALAKRCTNSTEEAEAAAQEIFIEIWKYAGNEFKIRSIGQERVALIACRRLLKHLHESK